LFSLLKCYFKNLNADIFRLLTIIFTCSLHTESDYGLNTDITDINMINMIYL